MRYAACIEYDGSEFNGWQTQKHAVRTVQQTLERALSRVADHELKIVTAGRTDAQVHASHQIIHFDTHAQRDSNAWLHGANRFLPHDVRVQWVKPVDDEFHARFAAIARQYRYIIFNQKVASSLFRRHSTHVYQDLDISAMRSACAHLLGEHDFSSFRAAGCQAHSPIRTLIHFELNQQDNWVWFDVKANAFLQHMVRNIAGCLIAVGSGKYSPEWVAEVLQQKDRRLADVTAPASGLYLTGVDYAVKYDLPTQLRPVYFWG